MQNGVPLFPDQVSTVAREVDLLFGFLMAVTAFFSILIFGMVIYFAFRYRRKSENDRPAAIHGNNLLEALWIVVPLIITMIAFVWGTDLYFRMNRPPEGAMEIYGVGKQWMWKFQHPEGPREINDLHVPVGVPVRVILTSEDVIHSFFVPAFRVKMDVLPGRYTQAWFTATKPGKYHLFCAEYCGTKHSGMIGSVIVMRPAEYEAWLEERAAAHAGSVAVAAGHKPLRGGLSMEAEGERLVQKLQCNTCHGAGALVKAPPLDGLYGKRVELADGKSAIADEAYIRESLLKPQAKLVKGYDPNMPTFEGLIGEEDVLRIMRYIRSLKTPEEVTP